MEAPAATSPSLAYAFLPSPNPIRATATDANPNSVDLQVIVSNPSLAVMTVARVTIDIPTGEETSRSISTARSLPAPTYDTTIPWTIRSAGSTVTLTPKPGPTGQVLGPIIFTLPGIQVNHTVGTVPVTITEFPPSPAPKVVDTSHSLLKLPSDFPVTSFAATPPTLDDLDVPVTLTWTCTDAGKLDAYSVYSDGWQPVDCINDGNCYTWRDGRAGVKTPDLSATTVFSLDVVKSDGTGHRSVTATLRTTVRLTVPSISSLSHLRQHFSSEGVTLYWRAYDASYCSVAVNGVTVLPRAPVDTYRQGLPLTLSGGAGRYQISLTAYAVTGPAQASFVFPEVVVSRLASIPVGAKPGSIAITPDGALAVVLSPSDGRMTIVDLATRKAEPRAIQCGNQVWSLAITPDQALALVTDTASNSVAVVNLKQRTLEPRKIALRSVGGMIAITPDSKLAFVTNFDGNYVTVIDVPSRVADPREIPVESSPYGIAITPDGALALVANYSTQSVTVIDVARRIAEPNTIPVAGLARGIAITPDGRLALVTNLDKESVTVIDISARAAEPKTIPVGGGPESVAITPDGTFALVANYGDKTLTVVDIIARAAVATILGAGTPDQGGPLVAVMPGGANALATDMDGRCLALF